ncbi:MAG TPA: FadR/GntR family transcriptional regulator [Devosiaceae bacterium]
MVKDQRIQLSGDARLYQLVARQIAQMIEEHAGEPGWHVPSERELADELGISRPVVREAIIALEMRGIVEVRGRAGIVVLSADAPQASFETIRDTGPGPFELLEARLAIEASAAGLAAEKVTPYDLVVLNDCIRHMEAEANVQLLHEKGDRDFHLHIAKMTGNAIIVSMIERLWELRDESPMWRKLHEHIHAPQVRSFWIGDHHAIVAALRMRNPEAAYAAMARHIRNVTAELLKADEQGRDR